MRRAIAAACLVLCGSTGASGQDPSDDPADTARMHLGPLSLTPTLTIKGLGIDSNVFNEVEQPKSDFTTTVGPDAQMWLRLGRVRLTATTDLDLVYFHRYASERSINTSGAIRLELPLAHVTPYVSESYVNTRDRPGFEIDARARHAEHTIALGNEVRIGDRFAVDASARRTRVQFAGDAVFNGAALNHELSRTADTVNATLRYDLTPYTRLVVSTEAQRERFEFSPERNSDSVLVTPGFSLDASALISGRAYVGFRKLDPVGGGTFESFRGAVASVDMGYTLLSIARFSLRAERDVQYSYEFASPYYVLTGTNGSVAYHLGGSWEIVASAGQQRLAYRRRAAEVGGGRVDTVSNYGAGLGYRFRQGMRIGVDASYYRRRSPQQRHDYEGLRIGSSVTYGF